ncbi:hypothetical protein T265_00745 [Opisthorchis viverrini]|uniref:Uncharacterized protein n=1 Tax=Opisthorchis viverrini TaxID=6198 RepID=A0A075A132_OPIVI|nr:hypothetical protein T265_00745 [Opisthorchis viverrini]KER33438.1 hypothetical protein T265_00745 [Opisthorchis viverrini]
MSSSVARLLQPNPIHLTRFCSILCTVLLFVKFFDTLVQKLQAITVTSTFSKVLETWLSDSGERMASKPVSRTQIQGKILSPGRNPSGTAMIFFFAHLLCSNTPPNALDSFQLDPSHPS